MDEVFRVLLRMRIRPDSGAEFEHTWRQGAEVIAGHPDNRGQWLARDSVERDVYYVMSDWRDEAGFRAYEKSASHAAHLGRLRPYRLEGAMSTMSVLSALPSNGKIGSGQ